MSAKFPGQTDVLENIDNAVLSKNNSSELDSEILLLLSQTMPVEAKWNNVHQIWSSSNLEFRLIKT